MRKYGRYICGVLTIAALLGTSASGPAPVAWAAEGAGEEVLRQDGQAAGDSQAAGDGQTGTDVQNPGDGGEASGGGTAGDAQKPGGGETGGEAQEPGGGQNGAGIQEPGDGQDGAGAQEPGGGQASGGGQDSGDSQASGDGEAPNDGQASGDVREPDGGQIPEDGQDPEEGQSPEEGQDPGDGSGECGFDAEEDPRVFADVDEDTAEWIRMAGEALAQIAGERDIMALVYLSDEYPVRVSPSYESEAAVTVLSGQTVNILDMAVDENMEVWHYVRLDYQGQEVRGYVPRTYLACSDERFLEWEEMFGMNAATYAIDGERAGHADIEQFPESYRPALLALKEKHPNWTFAVMNTDLDWQATIDAELQDAKSLIEKVFPEWTRNGKFDNNWCYASRAGLEMYMDPRNGLTEDGIFQFEQLTYNETYHTEEAVRSFLKTTFMTDGDDGKKYAPKTEKTFARIFWEVGRNGKVSPFHLASRVYQEQGKGDSPLISGSYPGYAGYYNFFNIGASGKGDEVIVNGLEYAKKRGWDNAEKSIQGGADVISANYIRKGQDTLYLQKFNVNPSSGYPLYTHQYMQNIVAPTSEGKKIKKLYEGAGALDNSFVFKIPVFQNMPAQPCGEPKVSTEVVVALPEGYSDSFMWLDGVAYQGEVRNGSLIVTAPDANAKTAVVYKYDEKGAPTGMYVWSLTHNGIVYTATAESGLQDLLTHHGFSIRIKGKSGIRVKTGISKDLRTKLLTTGVNGYVLKEYGTLVMNNANMSQYPMIKDGAKVAGSISYGIDGNGNKQDIAFELTEGRYRFTGVLVGIPVEQYKTEFAFRGYAVLEKNGAQVIVYGPPKARSIYELAKILLENGTYKEGSEAYEFLEKLVKDADELKAAAEEN